MLMFYLAMLHSEEEKQTFTEIYEQLRQKCFNVALSITHSKSSAEDAVQDAFVAAIKQKEKIFSLSCEKRASLIVIITKNKALDRLKSDKVRAYTPIEYVEDDEEIGEPDVSHVVERSEAYEYLIDCISALPENIKAVAEMKFVQDMRTNEIAELLGITPQNVSTRIMRAREILAKSLEENNHPTTPRAKK